jgi:hypothetical protein
VVIDKKGTLISFHAILSHHQKFTSNDSWMMKGDDERGGKRKQKREMKKRKDDVSDDIR